MALVTGCTDDAEIRNGESTTDTSINESPEASVPGGRVDRPEIFDRDTTLPGSVARTDPAYQMEANRPAAIEDTLRIEGTAETITARLYRTPDGFPVSFSTYVPEGLRAQTEDFENGRAISFNANFAERANPNAYLRFVIFPSGTSESRARSLVRGFAADLGLAASRGEEVGLPSQPQRYSWSITEYNLRRHTGDSTYIGHIALGRHQNHFFYLVAHFPPEYADGMGPRIAYILRQMRWRTG